MQEITQRSALWAFLAAVALIVFVAQIPLVLNPGYFSHDELQWAAFVLQDSQSVFRPALWTNVQSFQYRPLTFTLWLWLSKHLFAQPYLFHGAMVAWGGVNAAMLALLLRKHGAGTWPSAIGALVFALGPYASWVHGWAGTLADLIWVSCALLIALIAKRSPRPWIIAIASAGLTLLALLAKDAGIVIPALLALGWLFLGRNHGIAALASAIPVTIYLALRIGVLLFSPHTASGYEWSLAFIPQRWLEYQLFPAVVSRFEIHGVLDQIRSSILVSCFLWLAIVIALWRAGWRWVTAFLLAGFSSLGPVLVLAASANQYGYGFAAVTAGIAAAAWTRMSRLGKIILLLLAFACVWHGANIASKMRYVGQLQAIFSPALAQAVRDNPGKTLLLHISNDDESWIYRRLTHEIPSYDGTPIGKRVRIVESADAADYSIQPDGTLLPTHE